MCENFLDRAIRRRLFLNLIRLNWQFQGLLSDINYHINRINAEPLHLLSDVNIASLHFFAAAVEADDLFLLVDFLEHLLHLL